MQIPRARALNSPTGISGVAAMWVVMFHVQIVAAKLGIPAISNLPILKDGFRGVDLFFILSGFILMHVHQRDFQIWSSHSLRKFAILRVFRIYPLNTVILIGIPVAVLALPQFAQWYRFRQPNYQDSYSAAGFFQTMLLANRWLIPELGEWNGPVWSLSVEVIAYMIFPALAFFMVRETIAKRALLWSASFLLLLIVFQFVTKSTDENLTGRLSIARALTCFPAGVAVYRLITILDWSDAPRQKLAGYAAAFSVCGIVVSLLVPRLGVFAPVFFASLIGALGFQDGMVNRFLACAPILFLGEISFGLYLIHYVPLQVMTWAIVIGAINIASPFQGYMLVVAYLGVCMACASALRVVVELPVQRVGRRLVAKLLPTSTGAQVALD